MTDQFPPRSIRHARRQATGQAGHPDRLGARVRRNGAQRRNRPASDPVGFLTNMPLDLPHPASAGSSPPQLVGKSLLGPVCTAGLLSFRESAMTCSPAEHWRERAPAVRCDPLAPVAEPALPQPARSSPRPETLRAAPGLRADHLRPVEQTCSLPGTLDRELDSARAHTVPPSGLPRIAGSSVGVARCLPEATTGRRQRIGTGGGLRPTKRGQATLPGSCRARARTLIRR